MKAALAALLLLATPAVALAQARTPAPAKPPVAGPPAPEKPQGLQVDVVVPLKGPGGPFGAPVIDEPTRRLYLPRGPGGVLVLSLDGFKPLGEVPETAGSGAVVLDGDTLRGFSLDTLAAGGGGTVVAFDQRSLKPVGKVAVEGAQHMLMDVATRQLVVAGKDGAVSLIDPVKLTVTGTVALDGKQVVALAADRRGRAFAVLADKNAVAVIDLVAKRVATTWAIAPCRTPVAGVFESATFRLLLACRGVPPGSSGAPTGAPTGAPGADPMGLVMDGHSGKPVSNMAAPFLVEGLVADSQRRLLYLTSGLAASLVALRVVDFNSYEATEVAGTRPLASTGVVDPRTGRLILPWADYTIALTPGETAPQRRFQPNGGALLVLKRAPLE